MNDLAVTQQRSTPNRRTELSNYVTGKIGMLQAAYIRRKSGSSGGAEAAAAGTLARLRRAVTAAPGADPTVWNIVFDGMPASLIGHTDEPSRFEWAVHTALTLYAVHQQSQSAPMHRTGYSMGRSTRELADRTNAEEAVLRRFHALGTASSADEAIHHVRGLITQFRSADVPLDYGRLADDLVRLQDPRSADAVRRAWARDFYRLRDDAPTDTINPTPTNGEQP